MKTSTVQRMQYRHPPAGAFNSLLCPRWILCARSINRQFSATDCTVSPTNYTQMQQLCISNDFFGRKQRLNAAQIGFFVQLFVPQHPSTFQKSCI